MELFLDRTRRSESLATQLYAQVRDAIVEARLAPGTRLPSSRQLASDHGISRFTVTEAYGRLTAEGYVRGRAGGGSVVVDVPTSPDRATLPGALRPSAMAAQLGHYDPRPLATVRFDLRPGRPDPAWFPAATWRRCARSGLDRAGDQYGEPAGTRALRAALAGWSTRSRGVRATADDVVVTAGTAHAVDLLARVLLAPGDTVAVEDPCYTPIVGVLRAQHLRVEGVPVDAEGIVVDAIPSTARLVYVTPSHQYPLGVTMSRRRRIELLHWASAAGAAIVEDDYDTEFRSTNQPLEPLQRLDAEGRVVYVGTFSKVLSPSLRLGYAVVPRSILTAVLALRQSIDWCPPAMTQAALETFIEQGHLERHLRRARLAARARRQLVVDAIRPRLGPGARLLPSSAGLHVTVVVEGDHTDDALRRLAPITLVGSLRQHYLAAPPADGLVIGFGAIASADVAAAIETLAPVLG